MPRSPLYWQADEGSVSVNGALFSTRVTNIEIRGGGREIEQIRTFGNSALLVERPQEMVETSITAVVSGMTLSQLVYGNGSTTAGGILVSGDGLRSRVNVVYTWTDPTAVTTGPSLRIALFSGFGTSSEMTLGTDNQLEETFTFKTLPNLVRREFSSGPASSLVTASI